MKKFTLTLFVLLISFCFVLSGCSEPSLSMPSNYSQVVSNGGFVVGVGNYLYFGNAYKSYESLEEKSDNDGSNVKQHSVKRVEVEGWQFSEGGNVNYYNSSLKLNEEEKATYNNVVNKISGFETSNMFVVGDYLYFTTPNVHKNDSKEQDEYGQYEFNLISLFRIKLDGSGLSELYTTETDTAKFYLTGGNKQSILIYDDEKIMQIKCYENSKSCKTLAEDVTSTVFPYNQGVEIVDVYFTVDREDDDLLSGNKMKKLNIVTGEIKDVVGFQNGGETITLISYNGKYLYYTRTGLKSKEYLCANDFSGANSEKIQRRDASNFTASSKIYIIDEEAYGVKAFVFEYNDDIFVQNISEDTTGTNLTTDVTESAKIAFVDGLYVYYTTENGIYRKEVKGDKPAQQVSDIKDFNADLIDFDGRYVYFYAEVENASSSTKYLYRADTYACDLDIVTTEYIAELSTEDVEAIEDANNEDVTEEE